MSSVMKKSDSVARDSCFYPFSDYFVVGFKEERNNFWKGQLLVVSAGSLTLSPTPLCVHLQQKDLLPHLLLLLVIISILNCIHFLFD